MLNNTRPIYIEKQTKSPIYLFMKQTRGNLRCRRGPKTTQPTLEFLHVSKYTGAKKYWHPYYINTIEMRFYWMEIKSLKSLEQRLSQQRRFRSFQIGTVGLWRSKGSRASAVRPIVSEAGSNRARQNFFYLQLWQPVKLLPFGPTETHSTSLERSKTLLLTLSLLKSLAALLTHTISIQSDLISKVNI